MRHGGSIVGSLGRLCAVWSLHDMNHHGVILEHISSGLNNFWEKGLLVQRMHPYHLPVYLEQGERDKTG